ncbi:hypothetical protein E5676_scaffold552G00950 [Cucumis melo var. makuwa]|uniref:Uncharacterized protein n=1 Tax=Cucumis melo var. makuwa TaxID=1194695 RepID=A0A5D3CRT6_CUCMM|nr:hypothetical protein E6C27_scaffold24G002070 [Cucumis melo var. makuwa]TYK14593.1 hypothetical protein E5676_scaffold552G00950 [Cucumis melo var. makuwa]
MRGWGPYVQDLDSVLKGTTYLLTLKWVGVNSILLPMFPTIHLSLSLKWKAYWGNANELPFTYADLRIISCEQEFTVSSGLRLSYLGH